MFCTISETDGEVVHVTLVLAPEQFITDRSKAVVLLWFSVACFWYQSFGDVSCVFILFLVWFGLLSGHHLRNSCSLGWPYILFVFLLFVILVISHFDFLGLDLGSDCFSS